MKMQEPRRRDCQDLTPLLEYASMSFKLRGDNEQLSQCWYLSKCSFKSFRIQICDQQLKLFSFDEPERCELEIQLKAYQCIKSLTVQQEMHGNEGPWLSLQFFALGNLSIRIFFKSEDVLVKHYLKIVSMQGFPHDLVKQYEPISVLGQGSQGIVYLSNHKLSNIKYAIKRIDKKQATHFFRHTDESFDEINLHLYLAK